MRFSLKVMYQNDVEWIEDMQQVPRRGRGRPRKANAVAAGDHREASSPGPDKGSVPYKGVGHCLGPEGNGVSSGEGGEGGLGPLDRGEISSLAPAREEATWTKRKKGRRARRDNEDPACTE